MFDIDVWQEIFNTIRKNKLRTFLTGFSVAWGIFMLIILLAAGNGLKNGVMSDFSSRTMNTIEVWAWRTSMPYKGTPQGRRVRLDNKDLRVVERRVPGAYNVTAEVGTGSTASYGGEYASCYLRGVYPKTQLISDLDVLEGRFINDVDMRERRKVVLINERMKTLLFKSENPIGKYLKIVGAMFQVVGVYERNRSWGNDNTMYVPFTTAQQLFNKGYGINDMSFMVDDLDTREANEEFTADVRRRLAALHNVHPEDKRAIGIWSQMEEYLQTMGIFNGISLFLWIIGIGTLMAGVVGVSNIMLITVRERTREFGIRKALGATPASILRLILLESVMITALFGYVGMVAGVGISELVSYVMAMGGGDGRTIFKDPTVSIGIALMSTVVLIVAGVLAGYFPARKAIKITAVEAMRAE
jgi:putative ABC transport system permease protein